MDDFIHENAYIVIPFWVLRDKRLNANEKLLVGALSGLCNSKGYCWATDRYLAQLMECDERTISRRIAKLKNYGYITIKKENLRSSNGLITTKRYIYIAGYENLFNRTDKTVQDRTDRIVETVPTELSDRIYNNNYPTDNYRITNNIINDNYTSYNYLSGFEDCKQEIDEHSSFVGTSSNVGSQDNKNNIIYKQIIDYFNKKTGKRFKVSKATTRLISGRLKDGFTVDDFITVIDNKCAEWQNDNRMKQYLRPETLFAPSHFESYLNQHIELSSDDEFEKALREIE